jgi:hypothetical protein
MGWQSMHGLAVTVGGTRHRRTRYWTSNTASQPQPPPASATTTPSPVFTAQGRKSATMSSNEYAAPPAIPGGLSGVIHLNAAHRVLICTACRQAVRPRILARHLRRSHGIVGRIGKQVRKYVEGFPWDYTHSTAPWPGDGSEAQAVLAVIAGYECSMGCHGRMPARRRRQC